jgi:class 3 adenylate cyclase/pimeloyl-ACP methyl ester carboxylesterase
VFDQMGARVDSGIPETRWAKTIDGASIAYQDFGRGETTLVFIVGWISHIEVFWELPVWERVLRRLAKNMRVLLFDKRGVGMSDRLSAAPSLDVQMDDIRAVMDAAGVERAALYANGVISPALAAFFAATHPDRTVALWLDGPVHFAKDENYPWGESEADWEQWVATFCPVWGTLENALPLLRDMVGDIPENESFYADPATQRWAAKWARYSATPTSVEQLGRMWRDTDVRPILPTVCVPTAAVINTGCEPFRGAAEYVAARIPGCRRVEMDSTELHVPAVLERYVCALEAFIAAARQEEAALERRLATVLFTDIVGSTEKACALGDACWGGLLAQHHAVVRGYLGRYRGQEVKTTGDGFLATFDGPARAVRCAEGICRAIEPLGIEVRAGCHTGEIEVMGDDVGGLAVHIAARVAAKARPSEVLVSSTVKDLVAGSSLTFTDRGSHALKGVPGRWKLFACQAG